MHTNLNLTDKLQALKMACGISVGGAMTILLLINVIFPLSFETGTHVQIIGTGNAIGDILASGLCAALVYAAAFLHVHTIRVFGSTVELKGIGRTKKINLSDIKSIKRGIGGFVYTLKSNAGTFYISCGFKGLHRFLELLRRSNVKSSEW